jgi:plasmid stabilization system protein ParE
LRSSRKRSGGGTVYRCEVSPLAIHDAEEAYAWIAKDSPARAARWYQGLFRTIDTLRKHPYRCALAPESDDLGREVRQLLYGQRRGIYRILFSVVEPDLIRIWRIRHGARATLQPGELESEDPQE